MNSHTMNPHTIHETELKTIIGNILDISDTAHREAPVTDISKAYSISRATSALTMVFPTLVSASVSIDAASIVSKAIERKWVTMMQLALSAFNMSNSATNAIDFIRDFHTNINPVKMDLDSFIDLADDISAKYNLECTNMGESEMVKRISMIAEDCRVNIDFVFDDDINESSLSDFYFKKMGYRDVVMEQKRGKGKNNPNDDDSDEEPLQFKRSRHVFSDKPNKDHEKNSSLPAVNDDKFRRSQKRSTEYDKFQDDPRHNWDKEKTNSNKKLKEKEFDYRMQRDAKQDEKDAANAEYNAKKDKILQANQDRVNANNYFQHQLVSTDVKKANELVPSMMIINVMVKDPNGDMQNLQTMIGLKSKLYMVEPNEVVNKLITKYSDSNTLLKLIKVGTREISFFKDFLLAIDDAKLEALSKSKRGSSSKLFKALERRALGGKVRRTMGANNTCKPISSLVISSEEANYLLNYNDMDVNDPKVVMPIMEKLNLIYFVIVDESAETAKFLLDGDTQFETLAFSSLEKEANDGSYKKVVNLLSKIR